MLVRKHPKVAAVYPMDVRNALATGRFTQGQFDWVFLDDAVELDALQRAQVEQIARLAVIIINGDEWTVHDVSDVSVQGTIALAADTRTAP